MAPRYYEDSFAFNDDEERPAHDEGWAGSGERDSELWHLDGVDTFDGEAYLLASDVESREAATLLARARLRFLEQTQPSSSSGGQTRHGIQDQVWIVSPGGESVRVVEGF